MFGSNLLVNQLQRPKLWVKNHVSSGTERLVEGKFVDSLRAVAAEMAMEELHEKRVDFVQKVQQVVSEDLI
jgi:uncharacterized membrane protein YqiK